MHPTPLDDEAPLSSQLAPDLALQTYLTEKTELLWAAYSQRAAAYWWKQVPALLFLLAYVLVGLAVSSLGNTVGQRYVFAAFFLGSGALVVGMGLKQAWSAPPTLCGADATRLYVVDETGMFSVFEWVMLPHLAVDLHRDGTFTLYPDPSISTVHHSWKDYPWANVYFLGSASTAQLLLDLQQQAHLDSPQ